MTEPLRPVEDQRDDPEPEEVDVDLDAMGYEATGRPITVRVAGKVIHVTNAGDWTSEAMRASSIGDWNTWARETIDDDDEYKTWVEANLRNTQIEAVFSEVGRQSQMNQGKSQRRAGSRRGSPRR